eukprot:2503538-Amphidinium_carterae.1
MDAQLIRMSENPQHHASTPPCGEKQERCNMVHCLKGAEEGSLCCYSIVGAWSDFGVLMLSRLWPWSGLCCPLPPLAMCHINGQGWMITSLALARA